MADYSKRTLFSDEKTHHKNGNGTGVETRRVPTKSGGSEYIQSETKWSSLKQDYVTTKEINRFKTD